MYFLQIACLIVLASDLEKGWVEPAWKSIRIEVVSADGNRAMTNVLDFSRRHGKKGRSLLQGMKEAAREVPKDKLARFVEGLGLPAVLETNGEVRYVPRAQWIVHLEHDDLFNAEVNYLKAFVAAEAFAFLRCPPLSDAQRAKVCGQLELVLRELRRECQVSGFTLARVDGSLRVLRTLVKECIRPARYGPILQPQTDEKLQEAIEQMTKRCRSDKPDEDEQGRFVQQVGNEVLARFQRTMSIWQYEPGSKQEKLMTALESALRKKRELEKRLVTSRPAAPTLSSTSQPSCTRPAKPNTRQGHLLP